jgi:hypothetical protein
LRLENGNRIPTYIHTKTSVSAEDCRALNLALNPRAIWIRRPKTGGILASAIDAVKTNCYFFFDLQIAACAQLTLPAPDFGAALLMIDRAVIIFELVYKYCTPLSRLSPLEMVGRELRRASEPLNARTPKSGSILAVFATAMTTAALLRKDLRATMAQYARAREDESRCRRRRTRAMPSA